MPQDRLTDDDLDDLAESVHRGADPAAVVAALVAAVDEGRLADPEDEPYALGLAAEVAEEANDLETALALSRRAAELYPQLYFQAATASLLLRVGREDEGMAILYGLRPAMGTDWVAVDAVLTALESADRIPLAFEWATDALPAAYARWSGLDKDVTDETYRDATRVAARLATIRSRLREELGVPEDELDAVERELAVAQDGLRDLYDGLDPDEDADDEFDEGDGPVYALYWPEADFGQLIGQVPELSTVFGTTWDEHRSKVEGALAMLSATGVPTLGLLRGSFAELAGFAAARGLPVTDEDLRDEWAGQIEDVRNWPPPRNEPCWCGSGQKYKKCCLPRSRVADLASD
jgi:flagellar motility protein MotE (MotC chaperone)